ncbi:amino acid permease [Ilyonectria sp. MPI-CAGE-AT-0026]|nr:amino acid permease [Ilyonectria sp. MPI-CAGE-AT-0026]
MDTKDANHRPTPEHVLHKESDACKADEEVLANLGHEQELRREFSVFTLAALCSCLMASWEALATVITTALTNGGPPCLFYNYVMCFLCTVCITLSLAEIASIYPTAGGQYHWVAALSSASRKSGPAFATGWVSIGGQLVFSASAAFAAGLEVQGLIIMNRSQYEPTRWHGMLLYWAILAYSCVANVWGIKLLPHTNMAAGVIHVAGFMGTVITILVMSDKNPSSFVFVESENSSGWSNDAVSWLVGLLSAVYPFLGYDAACHLAEELPSASRNVPLAMIGTVVTNGLMGLVYCITLLYSTGSLESLLATPTGFPFMDIYLQATNSQAGTTVLSLTVPIIAAAASVAGLTSTSRTLWAFARDKATPFHKQLSKVDKRLKVPANAVFVTTALQAAMGFIYLGSPTAFNATLSMAIIGMYISYLLPIVYMLVYGRRPATKKAYRYFKLPDWLGVSMNVVSIAWIILVIIFSTFPTTIPVTPQTMNYSTVVLAGWLLFGASYYWLFGRAKFDVPMSDLSIIPAVGVSRGQIRG